LLQEFDEKLEFLHSQQQTLGTPKFLEVVQMSVKGSFVVVADSSIDHTHIDVPNPRE